MTIWSPSPSVSDAVAATQGALIQLKCWSEEWCLPLSIRANVRPPSSRLISIRTTSSFTSFYSTSHSVSMPLQHFLGSPLTAVFSSHAFSLKATFFTRLKALRCISASSWGSSKELFELLYKAFLRFVLYHASSEWFPFLAVTNVNKLKRLLRMACRANNGCLLSFYILLLSEASLPLYESL